MTTQYIHKYHKELASSSLEERALATAKNWPKIRDISDAELEHQLLEAFKILSNGRDLPASIQAAEDVVELLYRAKVAKRGFNIATQFLASASDRELLTIVTVAGTEVVAINLALNALRE